MPLSDTLLHRIHRDVVVIASYCQVRLRREQTSQGMSQASATKGATVWGEGKGAGCLYAVPSSSREAQTTVTPLNSTQAQE